MPSILALALAFLAAPSVHAPRQDSAGDNAYTFLVALAERGLDEELAREARDFLERYPRHAKADLARYRLAAALFDLGRHADARAELARLARVERFEFAAEVQFRLGQCELALGDPKAASAAFERASASAGAYLRAPCALYLGEARFRIGEYGAAAESYARAAALEPGSDHSREAEAGLAWCALRLGRHEEAARRAEALLEAGGNGARSAELHLVAGEAHLAAGNAQAALAHFASVPDGSAAESALRGAAFAAAALDDHRRSARLFGELKSRFPDGEHAAEASVQHGIELVRAGEASAARQALRDEIVPDGAETEYWRARASLADGDAEAALTSVERALVFRPAGELAERLLATRGDALAALGRTSEAAEAYGRIDSEPAARAAAVAAFAAGRTADAAALAERFLTRFPASEHRAQLLCIAAEGDLAAGRHQRAESRFLEAHAAAPEAELRARTLSRAAWCAFLRGEFASAAERFARVASEHAGAAEADEAAFMAAHARERGGDGERALALYRAYLSGARNGDATRRGEAWLAIARLDPNDEPALERALAEAPEPAAAALLLASADASAKRGDHASAIARYRDLLTRFPRSEGAARAHYGVAWSASESGDLRAADAALHGLAEARSGDRDLLAAAAELAVFVRAKLGDASGAVAAYRELCAGAAGSDEARCAAAATLSARALAEDGKANDAVRLLAERASKSRDRALACNLAIESAWIALDAKAVESAEAAARAALQAAPDDAARARAAETCLFAAEARFERGEDEAAIAFYELAAAHAGGDRLAQALYKLGFARLRSGASEAAAAALARVVADHPSSELAGESAFLLGEARLRCGDRERAVEAFALVRERWPRHETAPRALAKLAVALGELGRWKECERALAELDRSGAAPSAEIDLWRGRALAQKGEVRGARAAFERAFERDSGAIGARARLGLADLVKAGGDLEAALSEYLRVALLYAAEDEVALALLRAGECLEALRRPDQALGRYRELAEQHARHPLAARARERIAALGAR